MKTKERILNESIKLFAENGFKSTSMSSIANIIGITKPSIYSHYKNKLYLFEACLENISKEQIDHAERILNDDTLFTAEMKLFSLVNNCSLIKDDNIFEFYYRFYFYPPTELKDIVEKNFTESTNQCNKLITSIIAKAIDCGEIDKSLSVDEVKNSYNCLMNGLSCRVESIKNIENIWRVFWRGVKA